jgi:hypothetical protein
MAEINDPQLTEFCNADLRQIADVMVRLDSRTFDANATYVARNLGTVIDTGGSSNLITDGSATDGRTRVAGGDAPGNTSGGLQC